MYQLAYNIQDLQYKEVSKILANILIDTGNKEYKNFYYGIDKPINIINYIKAKNLKSLLLVGEDDINVKKCCLNLTTEELYRKVYNQLSPYNPGSGAADNWHCTTLYCSEPKNLYISELTFTSVVIGWDMALGESYNVYLDDVLYFSDANSPVFIDGLLTGTTHTIRINSGENDICNNSIEFTTLEEEANLIFSWDKLAGESVNLSANVNGTFTQVDWGDGTIDTLLTHTYNADGNYTVKFYHSTTTLLILGNKFGSSIYKLTDLIKMPSTITELNLSNNTLTTIPSLVPLTGLTKLLVNKNNLTQLDISANTLLTYVIASDNLFSSVTFDLSPNILLDFFEVDRANVNSVINVDNCPLLHLFQVSYSTLSVSEVNTILIDIDNNGVVIGNCSLDNQTPSAAPTGAGIVAKNNLIAKSWTVNTD